MKEDDDPPEKAEGSTLVSPRAASGTHPRGGPRSVSQHAATMVAEAPESRHQIRLDEASFTETERYELRSVLGEGGMGEVRLCRDRRIGREIAMKVVRSGYGTRSDLRRRFVYEARIQGQLEHPAIVPVYDLGRADDGAEFFTMKRVRGRTLDAIVSDLRDGDEATARQFSQRKLLTAFAAVCLALDFAHRRGVVHRDLKPANIMLGDFGEVYILDWGVAKIVGMEDEPGDARVGAEKETVPETSFGAIMGTPGYMPPEQVASARDLNARADVYALGALLFEILTREPLHNQQTPEKKLQSTLRGVEAKPSLRAPDREIAPELEHIVVRATAHDPLERYASSRELGDAIERYLDGDRDLELRRQMAERQAEQAEQAAELALTGDDPDQTNRKQAMRLVGNALALDPGNHLAMATMVRLLMEPPRELPREVADELEQLDREQIRVGGRTGAVAYASTTLYLLIGWLMGVRNWTLFVLIGAVLLTTALASYSVSRLARPKTEHAIAVLALGTLVWMLLSSAFGPFIVVPAVAAANTLVFSMANDASWRGRIIAIGCMAVVIPAALELAGVVPPSYDFSSGSFEVLPRLMDFPPALTLAFLAIASLATIITAGVAMGPFRKELDDAQRRIRLNAWSLRQMVPDEVFRTSIAPPARPVPGATSTS